MVTDNVTLNEIAKAVGLSKYHFLRIFKNTTGLPPHAYLLQMRVELAKGAIEKGLSLADAAFQSGFSDQSHMTRCFKAVYGLPPGQYKNAFFR
jgi:AraC-like DNA-binding protein